MEQEIELKVGIDKEFVINITTELLAYEIVIHALELGLDSLEIDTIYNVVHTEFDHQEYKEQIYKNTEKLLLEKYNIDMKL